MYVRKHKLHWTI